MNKILLTGGSGYVGRHLIRQILDKYPGVRVVSLSRSESAIGQLLLEIPNNRVQIVLGDVRDQDAVRYAIKDCDTVVHLAAMKRVDLAEDLCRDAATTNICGTLNILEQFKGTTFVLMSTDKAVEPCNCYGATKLVAERLVIEQSRRRSGARFMIVRSGNILGSTGSVLDIWKRQILEKNEITVTNPDMMRYYTSIDGIVRLYMAVLERGENGKIYYTPRGEAIILRDMINRAIKLYGNDKTTIKYIGLRPGERMEEKMCTPEERNIDFFEDSIYVEQETAGKV